MCIRDRTWHPIGPTGTGYAVLGAGAFDNSGLEDVAFRNTTTGDWGYMTITPGGGEAWHAVGPTSIAYAAVGVGVYGAGGLDLSLIHI